MTGVQTCALPILQEGVYERFLSGFTRRAAQLRVGNGLEEGVQMGPMANPRRPDAMERLIGGAVSAGAKLHTGGRRIGTQGYFYAPTVLSEIPSSAAIMNEEPFGPVALVNPFRTEEEMIAEANRLPYGLAAFSWTNDAARQRRLAREVETGMLCINTTTLSTGDAPFGGEIGRAHV